jgi:2-C-methyl-D-erythritol 4-phosphate cytidylyltransferase
MIKEKNFFAAILLAAGKSRRFSYKNIKKQFLRFKDKTLIEYVLDKFLKVRSIKQFLVVVPKENFKKTEKILSKYKDINLQMVIGGKERYNSVANAVKFLDKNIDYVLVHDVARPFVSVDLIKRCIEKIKNCDCLIPAINVSDTVKMINSNSEVIKTLDRENLVLVQTPQVFKTSVLKKIYSDEILNKWTKKKKITDDAQLAELEGYKVKVIEGEKQNFKITTREDLYFIKL